MSVTEKIWMTACGVVLGFFTISVLLFENLARNFTPPLQTNSVGYYLLGLTEIILAIYLWVSRKPTKVPTTPVVKDERHAIAERLFTEIKFTASDCTRIQEQLGTNPEFSVAETIEARITTIQKIFFLELHPHLQNDAFTDLLYRFVAAYTEKLRDILAEPSTTLAKVEVLKERILNEAALYPLIQRVTFKPEVDPIAAAQEIQLDPFLTQPLDQD